MRSRRQAFLRRLGSRLMLLAALALLLHGANSIAQQAAAAMGYLPVPAGHGAGSVHTHGTVGHFHADARDGHSHHPHDHEDEGSTLWSVGGLPAIIPMPVAESVSFAFAGRVENAALPQPDGIGPGRLSRPPSTPSIA